MGASQRRTRGSRQPVLKRTTGSATGGNANRGGLAVSAGGTALPGGQCISCRVGVESRPGRYQTVNAAVPAGER